MIKHGSVTGSQMPEAIQTHGQTRVNVEIVMYVDYFSEDLGIF